MIDLQERIEHDYALRLVDDTRAAALDRVREAYRKTATVISEECPRARDLALAFERLEESYNSAAGAIRKSCPIAKPEDIHAVGRAAALALQESRAAKPAEPAPSVDANAPQPPPKTNEAKPTWETVIANVITWRKDLKSAGILNKDFDGAIEHAIVDMAERDKMGRAKYGTPLQPNNGRDHLTDEYQELLDAAVYAANDVIQLGGDLSLSKPAYCNGPGGMIMLYGCTYPNPDKIDLTLSLALARFWKVLDLAVGTRMEIDARSRRAATAS